LRRRYLAGMPLSFRRRTDRLPPLLKTEHQSPGERLDAHLRANPLPPIARRPVADAGYSRHAPQRALQMRDDGMRRLRTVTHSLVAGAVALTGALAVVAANGFRGHTVVTPTSSAQPLNSSAAPANTATAPSPAAVQAPNQAPTQTAAAPVAVSGGS
jgi:hypothetical protein